MSIKTLQRRLARLEAHRPEPEQPLTIIYSWVPNRALEEEYDPAFAEGYEVGHKGPRASKEPWENSQTSKQPEL